MWLLGVVVRRYIDFLILLIPTPLVSVFFCRASLLFVHFFNVFRSLIISVKWFVSEREGEGGREHVDKTFRKMILHMPK